MNIFQNQPAPISGRSVRLNTPSKDSDSPGTVSGKTYYVCRRIITEKFNIEPQKGATPRLAFEATVSSLVHEIGAEKSAKDSKPTKLMRRGTVIGPGSLSQEEIIGCLDGARMSLVNEGVFEISRKDFITSARNLMSKEYGLEKTVLRPNAKTGVYSIINSQMQRFFKRSGSLAMSGGSKPNSLIKFSGNPPQKKRID